MLGRGRIRTIVGTDPAAGVEFLETVPAGEIWEVLNVRFTLVTDATAINRTVRIVFTDGVNNLLVTGGGFNQAASLSVAYVVGAYGVIGSLDSTNIACPIPPRLMLLPGWTIGGATINLQAGDDFDTPILTLLQL